MVMQDYVEIDGTDVTDYRLNWDSEEEWDTSIDSLIITFSNSIGSVFSLSVGSVIIIKRGFTTAQDEYVFEGQITQVKPETSIIKLVCKGALYDAIKSSQTKTWDKDIDTEGGVGSEIFKSICDHSSLTYSPAAGTLTDGSIVNTGSADETLIKKFVQNDEDDFDRMNELARIYNYTIRYDYDNSLVEFKPKGYVTYPADLNIGTEIPDQIKWVENMEQLKNKVKIQGATVYDKIPETFAGPASEFTLSKTPEDTEVYINYTTTKDIQTRGQKDIGTLGTDFDYYVNVEEKKLIFSGNVSDVYILYGAQVPMDIVLTNDTSIDLYGGPNKKPHTGKYKFTDIKDVADAETRGRAILNKYSLPFIEAKNVPVINSVIQANGNIVAGNLIRIIDTYNDKDVTVFVRTVKKSWPHVYDKIDIGDEVWRTEDWQANQMKKIEGLISELNKNQDIVIQTIDVSRENTYERRYAYAEIKNAAGSTGIYGHPVFGLYGTAKYGSATGDAFVLGHPTFGILETSPLGESGTAEWNTIALVQGNNTYKEYIYDEDFFDSTSTATINTTTNAIDFVDSTLYTDLISAWSFDGDVLDDYASNDATTNNTTYSTGILNQCLEFNGTTAYTDLNTRPTNGEFSIAFWFKTTDVGNQKYMFNSRATGGTTHYLRIYLNTASAGNVTFELWDGATKGFATASEYNDGNWHLAIMDVDDNNNEMIGYIDNVQVGSYTSAFSLNHNAGGMTFGKAQWTSSGYWAGSIDAPTIWDSISDSDRRTKLWNAGIGIQYPTTPSTSLTSESINIGETKSSAEITINFTGSLTFKIATDGDESSPTYDTVALVSGVKKVHTFTTAGDNIKYEIESDDAVISSVKNSLGKFITPGVNIKMIR